MRHSLVAAQGQGSCGTVKYDNDTAYYYWQTPDEFGDTMQFVRFSPAFACTLKTVQFWVGDASVGRVGTPGARISIYSEAGGFPDTLIASVVVPYASLVHFPDGPNLADFSGLNLTFDRDFCVVIQRSGAAGDTLSIFSDNGSVSNLRSGEFWAPAGAWEYILDGWGVDVNFIIRADLCCGNPPACTPGAQPEWPTYGGSFERTFRSLAAVNNECQLSLDWIAQGDSIASAIGNVSPFTNVVVSDTLAFLSFFNFLACYDVRTGVLLWKFSDLGRIVVGDDLRCNVTVDDSLVYVGGGSFRAFNCVRVQDGSLKWTRNPIGTPLSNTGITRFTPSVIKDSVVYTVTEASPGEVWALNKYTGANYSGWATNPRLLSEGWVLNGLTSDGDSLLFAGTVTSNSTLTNGRLYAIRMSSGVIKWTLEDPSAKFLNPTLDQEGFSGFLAYENGILYYQSNIRDDANGFDHFPWDGSAGAIDVNAENGTGSGILWVATQAVGRALYGGPVVSEGVVYLNCDGIFVGASNPKGVIALNKSNGSRLWANALDGFGVPMPLTVTCEPGTNPYVFSGSRTGAWYLLDGFTGEVLWTRTFSGLVHGTAVLDSTVLVSTRSSLAGNGNGRLAAFRVSGANRPRMEVHQLSAFATNALPGSGNTTVDTIYGALSNEGCANLTIGSFGIDTVAVSAAVTAVDPRMARLAGALADQMAPHYLDFAPSLGLGPSPRDAKFGLVRFSEESDGESLPLYARDWARRSATAAASQVVTVETPAPAVVAPGNSLDLALRINETGQIPRTSVRNYVVLNHDDPDFFPEDTAQTSLGAPVIPVDAIFGYAKEQDTLRAMDALSLVTNHGSYGEGQDALFYVEGDATASLFDGSFVVSGKLDDTARTSWDNYDWAEFQADTFLTMARDVALGTFTGADTVFGTIARSIYIDSIGFPDSAQTYAFGVEVRETQVGFDLIGQGIQSFKLIQYCVINRNASPVDSVLYLGSFMDWDVESGANNVDTTLASTWANVFEYDPGSGQSAYGIVKLPYPGASYKELDGGMHTGRGFYSVYAVDNASEVYPSGTFYPISDHIHDYMRLPGLRSRGGFNRNADMSIAVVLDTVHLGPFDTVYVRCALWGSTQGGQLSLAARDAAFGANLTAGFRRGDVNADGNYDFLDLVYLYRYVQAPGSALKPIPRVENGDVNGDGLVNQADVDYLETYLYGDGPAPIGKWWW
jgi:hypothetical protein